MEESKSKRKSKWHLIHGEPYVINQNDDGTFFIVTRSRTITKGENKLFQTDCKNLDLRTLVLGGDIEEFFPDGLSLGFLVPKNVAEVDRYIVRGLRHLARKEGALYVSYTKIEDKYFDEYVQGLKSGLVLPRFFNRTYGTGIAQEFF